MPPPNKPTANAPSDEQKNEGNASAEELARAPSSAPNTTRPGVDAADSQRSAPFKGPTLRNKSKAPFWFDETVSRPADGLALKQPVILTEKQWKRRTPQQWGVLLANETIELRNIPAADEAAVLEAEDKERSRLNTVRVYNDAEQAMLREARKR